MKGSAYYTRVADKFGPQSACMLAISDSGMGEIIGDWHLSMGADVLHVGKRINDWCESLTAEQAWRVIRKLLSQHAIANMQQNDTGNPVA